MKLSEKSLGMRGTIFSLKSSAEMQSLSADYWSCGQTPYTNTQARASRRPLPTSLGCLGSPRSESDLTPQGQMEVETRSAQTLTESPTQVATSS